MNTRLTRRSVVKASGRLLIASSAPVLLAADGCGGVDPNTAAQIILLVAQAVILVGEIIKGSAKVSSKNTLCRGYEIAIGLVEASTGKKVGNSTLTKSICTGDSTFNLDEWALKAMLPGKYKLSTNLDGQMAESQTFNVGS